MDLVLLASIGAVSKHAADVAHHDRRLRHRPRQRDHIGELRMVAPGIERQPVRGELRHPGADFGPGVHMGRRIGSAVADGRVGIVADRIAHAREPAAAGAD